MDIQKKLKATIRDIPDFPRKGIIFKDITPILKDPELIKKSTEALVEQIKNLKIDAVMGIESRGFLWGLLLAQALNKPFIPVRKSGKLPHETVSYKYDLEYGSAEIEVHRDAIKAGDSILIHDDLLATGGTACAAANIVERQGAKVAGFSFLVILEMLNGKQKLEAFSEQINGLVTY